MPSEKPTISRNALRALGGALAASTLATSALASPPAKYSNPRDGGYIQKQLQDGQQARHSMTVDDKFNAHSSALIYDEIIGHKPYLGGPHAMGDDTFEALENNIKGALRQLEQDPNARSAYIGITLEDKDGLKTIDSFYAEKQPDGKVTLRESPYTLQDMDVIHAEGKKVQVGDYSIITKIETSDAPGTPKLKARAMGLAP